ncbi:BPSL0761 family protein [Pelomonas sp. SE-A7]|uniref:BPSL0761 family protein n=1 Tax=Pelomonas sp. SE-A7 TaxID=3054953 RepID=UPI0033904711
MTTPAQRTLAVLNAELFLCALTTESPESLDVPRILMQAGKLLAHFPRQGDLALTANALPSVWGEPLELGPAVAESSE